MRDRCRRQRRASARRSPRLFADELLGRNGRLGAAVGRLYARRLEAHPELADVMRRGNRGREVEMGLRERG